MVLCHSERSEESPTSWQKSAFVGSLTKENTNKPLLYRCSPYIGRIGDSSAYGLRMTFVSENL